jgi:hypothetical protein
MSSNITRRRALATLSLLVLGACQSTGGLGSILGSVLGGGNQVSGSVQSVDTRNRQVGIRQTNGQTVYLNYDNNTQVVYNNQNYAVTNLESGDQVTATVQDNGNGAYYTNQITVTQSIRDSNGQVSGTQQSYQGTVRGIDRGNGYFTIDDSNIGRITVTLPSNLSRADNDRYNNLRVGDVVRFYGFRLSTSQVQLYQFY